MTEQTPQKGGMVYIQYNQPQHNEGATKYVGAVAEGYDQKRETSPKWNIEQNIIIDMLNDLPAETVILDAPCGTGRFFDFYQDKKFKVCGLDLSADMLNQATKKVRPECQELFRFAQGDVRQVALPDKSVDVAVMCRLTRWLDPQGCKDAIKELQRVAKQRIIFTARVANHPEARPLEIFESALDGWKVARDIAGYVEDYRIIMLEPV